jgi:hypothetical protein
MRGIVKLVAAAVLVALVLALTACEVPDAGVTGTGTGNGSTGGTTGGAGGGTGGATGGHADVLTGGLMEDVYTGGWRLTVNQVIPTKVMDGKTALNDREFVLVEIDFENVSSATGVLKPEYFALAGIGGEKTIIDTESTAWLKKAEPVARGSAAGGQLVFDVVAGSPEMQLNFTPDGGATAVVTIK